MVSRPATRSTSPVRPEKIAIDEEVEEGMVSLDATVEARVYLG